MYGPDQIIAHYRDNVFMWTANPDQYRRIRELYQTGMITHVNLNLLEDGAYFDRLKSWADRNGYVFDCVYISNIPKWTQRMGSHQVNKMKENLLKIITPATILIDAKQEVWESGEPKIRLHNGINSEDDFPSFTPARRTKNRRRQFFQIND